MNWQHFKVAAAAIFDCKKQLPILNQLTDLYEN